MGVEAAVLVDDDHGTELRAGRGFREIAFDRAVLAGELHGRSRHPGIIRGHDRRHRPVLQQRQRRQGCGGTAGEDRETLEKNAPVERGMGIFVIEIDNPLIHVSLPIVWPIDDMRTLRHTGLFPPKGLFGGPVAAGHGRAQDRAMAVASPLLRLAPALLLAVLLQAGTARADSSDELQVDGKLDAVELGGEAAHKETVEGMITDLTPEIDSGRLSDAQLARALAVRCWAYYEKGLLDRAVADCNRLLASQPDHGTALLLRASAYIRLGRFPAAVSDLDHAIADGGLAKDDLGLAYLRRAIAREAMGKGKDAAEDVKQAVTLDPRLMEVYRDIDKAMLGEGKAGSAVQALDQAFALDPKSAQSYLDRGVARMARGQVDGAIADFDKALEIDPYMAAAFQHRGDARFHHGLDLQAIEDFDRAMDLDAHLAPVLKARA